MEEIMRSEAFFILPLLLAYSAICLSWFVMNGKRFLWQAEMPEISQKARLDLFLALLASFGILGIGQLYSAGFLIPKVDSEAIDKLLIWPLNNLLIFSPIFLLLIYRKQSPNTIYLSSREVFKKLGFGFIASLIGLFVFLLLRGELHRFPEILQSALSLDSISNFPAVFLENVALAFLFIRLKWATNLKWALAIPAFLFALGHVPSSLAEGDPWMHILSFFFLTASITILVLYTLNRSKDILWLGLVHYFMDLAIKAF